MYNDIHKSTRNYRNDPKTVGALNKTHRVIAIQQAKQDIESSFMVFSAHITRAEDQRVQRRAKRR